MRVPGRARPLRRSRRPGATLRRHRVGARTRTRWPPRPRSGSRTSARRASPTRRSWRAATGAARRVYFVSSFARSADGSAADHFGQVWRYDPHRAPPHPGDRLRPGHRHPAARRVPGQHLPRARRRPDGLRGRRRRAARLRRDPARRGLRDGPRRARTSARPRHPEWGEFAGVTFSPDGRTMYVNCYTPGTTFAVTGPWRVRLGAGGSRPRGHRVAPECRQRSE